MIGTDVILVAVLVLFVIFVLNLNIVNAKKIRRNQAEEKLKKIDEETKVEVSKQSNDDSNYLHNYFNSELEQIKAKPVSLKEAPEEELAPQKQSVKDLFLDQEFEEEVGQYHSAGIVHQMDDNSYDDNSEDNTDDEQEDYEIGIDETEETFTNELSEEYQNLSPEMKAFIMANVLKNEETDNDGNKKF